MEITKHLIKMKQLQVEEKRKKIGESQKLKSARLKELEMQIREKKEEILNYRKNLILREKWTEKLKG